MVLTFGMTLQVDKHCKMVRQPYLHTNVVFLFGREDVTGV